MIHTLDLQFLDLKEAIGSFLIETSDGPVLIETGPYSTFENLRKAIENVGFHVEDIKHVLLTHIHFDHAGAAWAFAKHGAKIYVHPFGAPHLAEPSKLYNSAKMIYGDEMERLWGIMEDIPTDQIISPSHGEEITFGDKTFKALHTPGHAKHHIAWQLGDVVFTGDVAGVKINDGPVVPPCPPPDINLEDWSDSLDILLSSGAKQLYLTHFDAVDDVKEHIKELRIIINDWSQWVKTKWESGLTADEITPEFSEYTANQLRAKGVDEIGVKQYAAANPSWMSVAGLIRYWKKKSQQ